MREDISSDNLETHEVKRKSIDDISTENSITSTHIQEEKCKIDNNYHSFYFMLFVSFSAHENDVITNEGIINISDTQIQKQKKCKYYNNVSILILDNILVYTWIISRNVLHFV